MQKQAPSPGRILVAIGFALSCFALLLFLWVAFGGPVPFKPTSYRFTADYPEAITLADEAEVRIGGVTVGKVKETELGPGNATRATIEIDPEYAPISSDARTILRQKTLLGETYVELTTGTEVAEGADGPTAQASTIDVGQISGDDAPSPIPEGGHLAESQVQEQVQIDEIFQALDDETRQAFQLWMKNSAIAIDGRGLDLNDAFGNLGPFSQDASDVLETLRRQEDALRQVVRSTGTVFNALSARNQELAGAIVGNNRTFRALASRDEALAESFRILPTFQVESRLTLDRLEDFARHAGPLFRDLRPVARDLSPTLRDLRRLAPNARHLLKNLRPLIKASATGLPALRDILDELRPVMVALDPFLSNLNPVVRYLDYQSGSLADFLASPPAGLSGVLTPIGGEPSARHALRQASYISPESVSIYPGPPAGMGRVVTNRGNGYLQPYALGSPASAAHGETFPSFDCDNTSLFNGGGSTTGGLGDGQVTSDPSSTPSDSESGQFPLSSLVTPTTPAFVGENPIPPGGPSAFAPCTIPPDFPAAFGGGRAPRVFADP